MMFKVRFLYLSLNFVFHFLHGLSLFLINSLICWNCISSVMVSVLASNVVDSWFLAPIESKQKLFYITL